MQDADATEDEQAVLIQQYFGSVGRDVCLCPGFMCDSGKNIHVGDQRYLKPSANCDIVRIEKRCRR